MQAQTYFHRCKANINIIFTLVLPFPFNWFQVFCLFLFTIAKIPNH